MDGDNDIDTCYDVTLRTQRRVFWELAQLRVELGGMILKPNMVVSGKKCATQASPQEVAEKTLACLYHSVPPAVPGIAFLSGGQPADVATLHLDLMNKMGPHPWQLTFSYGRALQDEALRTWKGSPDNVGSAQKVFTHRAALAGAARSATYDPSLESGDLALVAATATQD